MAERTIMTPGPGHPISIVPNPGTVTVQVGGTVVARTTDALTLTEAAYPAVQYVPRKDVDMAALSPSATQTYCPYKGEASYFSIPAGGTRSVDAAWSYEAPYDSVAGIKAYIAFYPDRVDTISIKP